ncbi:hypothetical protein [Miniphocaeibacter halophilus]|uniref:Uncharacterized protein n=1 Tax=Miniphocaeibacter halophilus TaxID=2931922 RepID=A0AC61MP31_9FIRM|nr:hypothetical protein [Miniphocaeibacter halophilus]QQK07280.1 hypothetical protein JFY71_08115 [Miniphocaeibacter halophilus]
MIFIIFVLVAFWFLCIYSLYGIGVIIKTIFKTYKKSYDELEIKTIKDSLAISMILIVILHFIQLIFSFYSVKYRPIITPITDSAINNNINIHSLFFDCILIGFIYNIKRFKYGLIAKRQFWDPILIILTVTIILTIASFPPSL